MIFQEGDSNLSETIKEIEYGFLINRIAGNGINNYSDGRFVVIVEEGFAIVNGRIVGSAKNAALLSSTIE